MSDKLKFLKRIAKLGSQGYEPTQEINLVELSSVNASATHENPAMIYVREDGETFVHDSYLHDLEQDLSALIASLGIKTDGRNLHVLVPYAAQRIGVLDEHFREHPPESDEEPEDTVEDEVPEDANTD